MASPPWNFLIYVPSAGHRQATPPAERVAPFGTDGAGMAAVAPAAVAALATTAPACGGVGVTGLNTGAARWPTRAEGAAGRDVLAVRPRPGDKRRIWPGQIV